MKVIAQDDRLTAGAQAACEQIKLITNLAQNSPDPPHATGWFVPSFD